MEQLSGCHGDHSLAQRLEASSLTTPSPTGELALMLRMLVPLLYLGKTPALLRLLISTQTLITTLQCQLVQYREWATSVLPWLSHQRMNVKCKYNNNYAFNLCFIFTAMVGVIAGVVAGLIIAVVLLTIIICIVCM